MYYFALSKNVQTMSLKKYYILSLFISFLTVSAIAQPSCGFDYVHNQALSTNSVYSQKTQSYNNNWSQYAQQLSNSLIVNGSSGTVYEIPIVLHVLHTGGAVGTIYNPSTSQLTGLVDYLNAAYAATWASYPDSNNGGTHFPIKFVLAKRDPQCNSSSGIDRINASSVANYTQYGVNVQNTNGASEVTLKNLARWPNKDYVNVFIVNKIDGADGTVGQFIAGYAYFPGGPDYLDGVIMLATQATQGAITLPHELGHFFSLYHTFQGGSTTTCPANANCNTQGDLICDTEPEKQSNFNCPANPNPCTGNSYNFVQHNFMDYSNCQDRFTPGQRTRWIYGLLNSRPSLLSSQATVPLGTLPTAAACIPTIANSTNTANAGPREVIFNDMDAVSGGYNDDSNKVYIDRTCIQGTTVKQGQTYNLQVSTGPNAEKVRVYLDINNDGTFQASELIYSHTGTVAYETHSTNYQIPSSGVTTCTPLRMRVVTDPVSVATAIGPCTQLGYGQAEDYSVTVRPSGTIVNTVSQNPSCSNSSITFTASATGVTTPTYQWFVNGVAVSGATASTYTTSTIANGASVSVKVNFTSTCGNDSTQSNVIIVNRVSSLTPSVSIALTNGSNPGCLGQSLTFTATPVNGGFGATYTWKVNGTTVAVTTVPTYTTSTLTNGSVVTVTMTITGNPCATTTQATSNAITIQISSPTPFVTLSISGGNNPSCKNKPVTFTATPTSGGNTPTYIFRVNGQNVSIGLSPSFTTTTLNNGDTVQVILNSSLSCASPTSAASNYIIMTIIPVDTPKVTANITAGSNPGCKDSLLTFSASSTFLGNNPQYTWFVNGAIAGAGTTFSSTILLTGDVLTLRAFTTAPGCRTSDTVYTTVNIIRYPAPATPIISFINSQLVSNITGVQWFGPTGLIPGATSVSYHPLVTGTYYCVGNNNGCFSSPSNKLTVSLLSIGSYTLNNVSISPNPTKGIVTIDWGARNTSATIVLYNTLGQELLRSNVIDASRKEIDLSSFANGVYYVHVSENNGSSGTVRIALMR